MNLSLKIAFVFFFVFISLPLTAQLKHAVPVPINIQDSTVPKQKHSRIRDVNDELDLIDIVQGAFDKHAKKRVDTGGVKSGKLRISGLPAAGYTLQTGFAGVAIANAAFYTSKHEEENQSNILANLTYSQYKQIIFPIQTNIWTPGNKYNISSEIRFVKYPSLTYGLGGHTSLDDGYTIDYSGFRVHAGILRSVLKDIYAGVGYNIDYFWNIREVDPSSTKATDFQKYGLTETELASGVTLNFLYDNRRNSINPQNGAYINVVYRPNFTFLGSDDNWQSLVVDMRKYFRLPFGSDNVLCFWNYDWLTVAGTPPYLMLPNTGGDAYTNTGRGYIQGRFRGKNMLYAESEYRFNITNNELIGGVVFVNAESFSEEGSGRFEVISPGYGAGLRIKLNKFSRTNVAIDYGFGTGGSRGFFVNLGEVF
ncbi:MAG: BamA/TamA family outer membrane protein [Bacteroidetes bacterium]|nr:BamA/TamA family outer membrane protein [Bacteroidota bacterium]